MSRDGEQWVDALVSGLIIGCLTVSVFVIKALVLLVLRCWDKYRTHRLMRGVLTGWAMTTGLALALALMPGTAAIAGWLAVSTTVLAIGTLAVSELILDYRMARAEATDEDLTRHLGPW